MSSTLQPSKQPNHIVNTEYWNELMHDIFGPRKGGAIIFIDAQNARKGVAKTSGAVAFARLLSKAFGYDLKKDDLTIAGTKYLRRYQEHPGKEQPSVLLIDELVGAGTGDKRRAMASKNLDMGRAWQMLRAKRVVTLTTLPDWHQVDPRLQKLAGYRMYMLEQPIGAFRAYKIVTPFNNTQGSDVKCKGYGPGDRSRRILFPNMDAHDDPYYEHITKKKTNLIDSDTWDADEMNEQEDEEEELTPEEVEKRAAIKYAIRLSEPWDGDGGRSYRDVAEVIDDYSYSWVGEKVREWRNNKHRDLVPDPTTQ